MAKYSDLQETILALHSSERFTSTAVVSSPEELALGLLAAKTV